MITEKELQRELRKFEVMVFNRYGRRVVLHYREVEESHCSVEDIYEVCNRVYFDFCQYSHPKGIRADVRWRDVVLYRDLFFKVCRDHGHTFDSIGKVVGRDHASALVGCKRAEKVLAAGKRVEIYNLINFRIGEKSKEMLKTE